MDTSNGGHPLLAAGISLSTREPLETVIAPDGRDRLTCVAVCQHEGRWVLAATAYDSEQMIGERVSATLSRIVANYLTDEERLALGRALLAPEFNIGSIKEIG